MCIFVFLPEPDFNCTEDELKCGDNYCIPLDWKCDSHMDCIDFSDEKDCPKPSMY